MKITALMENTKNNEDLACEHGLSLYIEFGEKKILLDTGASGSFLSNGEKLGVNIEEIDMVVLSHGHNDHGGGMLAFFSSNSIGKMYLKKEATKDYYSKNDEDKKYIGLNKDVLEDNWSRLEFINEFTEVDKNIFIVTDIKGEYPLPEGNKNLYMEDKYELKRDEFNHELVLVIRGEGGIVVFTGCAHNGIINIIKTVKDTFPKEKIKGIIGGFHLMTEGKWEGACMENEEIDKISKVIMDEEIGRVYTGHCTGEKGYLRLKEKLGDRIEYLSGGAMIDI